MTVSCSISMSENENLSDKPCDYSLSSRTLSNRRTKNIQSSRFSNIIYFFYLHVKKSKLMFFLLIVFCCDLHSQIVDICAYRENLMNFPCE